MLFNVVECQDLVSEDSGDERQVLSSQSYLNDTNSCPLYLKWAIIAWIDWNLEQT